ncbi:unnamed protein product [Rotaria sordida]|uniref:Uncharacterized protein n=2 Tax=Rotaria sordida TaxID=392033 RepID=A0A814E8G8_9BILA|nr:unnamed protein product [Rotaria sordida]
MLADPFDLNELNQALPQSKPSSRTSSSQQKQEKDSSTNVPPQPSVPSSSEKGNNSNEYYIYILKLLINTRTHLDEFRTETANQLEKTLSIQDNVSTVESLIVNDKNKLIELNKKLDQEIISFGYLKESIEKKIQVDYEDII